jgi:hypothetical protein
MEEARYSVCDLASVPILFHEEIIASQAKHVRNIVKAVELDHYAPKISELDDRQPCSTW